jgi:ATP-binding cassette, subfamily C, bacterial
MTYRAVRYGLSALRWRPVARLAAWSVPETLPTAVSGFALARAVDAGFLAGRPAVGLAWLGALVAASLVGAVGARRVYRCLGDLVEPVRDDLVRRVVAGALHDAVTGGDRGDGAVARLTRQVEVVRDAYAGLIVVVRGFLFTVVGVVAGLVSLSPVVAAVVLPGFVVGLALFLSTLGMAAARQRVAVRAEERLAAAAGAVVAGVRDVVARGAERHAAALVAGPVAEQAAAERALGRLAGLRALCFAVGGWVPLIALLLAAPWLVRRGLSTGAILGGLTYVLTGLQSALRAVISGLGAGGLRFVVTLNHILDVTAIAALAAPDPTSPDPGTRSGARHALTLRGVGFAYGPHAQPVLRDLDLDVPEGDHLAVVGPSGIGKSTLAGLLCGLLRPDSGTVLIGGEPALGRPRAEAVRVLIPQEAYVFTGTVRDNVTYLDPTATSRQAAAAFAAVGAGPLLDRLGGLDGAVNPAELSAGERQLLALVRAYLSPAPLAVLDEATCHLDPVTEAAAEQAFAGRGGTLIVIAHRLSSALRARRVLVLDGERIAVGDPATLAATSDLFRELLGHWQPDDHGHSLTTQR